MTECSSQEYLFQAEKTRKVVAEFSGGEMSSDGGLVLIRELDRRLGITKRFAECFHDYRDPELVTYDVEQLVAQRVYGLVAGYEDLNDHETLRHDPLFRLSVGEDVLAGKSTLNRVENTSEEVAVGERYRKVQLVDDRAELFFVEEYLRRVERRPRFIVIDADANDVTIYGKQEERHFHGFYGDYCYLPLSFYVGDHLIYTKLRPSNIDASLGTVGALEKVIPAIRKKYPKLQIILRGDSGFAREEIMRWCEANGVDFVLGLAKNARLVELLAKEIEAAEEQFQQSTRAVRIFSDFSYQTLDSWSRRRRVVGKAEHLEKGSNPRFVVTSLTRKAAKAVRLYEKWYCARGDMENRIKEQLQLFSDRLSVHAFRGNQIRLYLSGVAYVLMSALRRKGLRRTELARAYFDTIRLKLLKIGAQVIYSARRVLIRFAESYPFRDLFGLAHRSLLVT